MSVVVTSPFLTRTECPVCGERTADTIYSSKFCRPPVSDYLQEFYSGRVEIRDLADASFIVQQCATCGLIFQRDILTDEFMGKLYESWINPEEAYCLDTSKSLKDYCDLAQEIMTIIHYFGRPPRELQLLDFGMGWGHWCRMAQAFDCQVWGMEMSANRIAHAHKFGIRTFEMHEMDGQRFDFINTEQVFEHIAQPLETLVRLGKSLTPTGLVKISVPRGHRTKANLTRGDWSAPKGSKYSLNPIAPLEHINCFSRSSLDRLAARAGLEPVHVSLLKAWQASVGWRPLVASIKRNFLRPVWRTYSNHSTYCLYRRKPSANNAA